MHPAVMDFLLWTKVKLNPQPPYLELGSLNINGTPRAAFPEGVYVGIDLNPGNDVDIITNAHNLPFPSNCFNTVISTEMLEHDPDPRASLVEAFRALRPGGVLIVTAATGQRAEHEVWTTGHYQNISRELVEEILESHASDWRIEIDSQDIQFWAVK